MAQEVAVPTYTKDIVGEVRRWDERDIVFARSDLAHRCGSDDPQYQAYYAAHPEHLEYDQKVNAMPGLGHTGGIDVPMFECQFAIQAKVGLESYVDGTPAADKTVIAPERAAQKVKGLARLYGADLVKIGPLRQEWVYTNVGRIRGDGAGYRPWGAPIDLSHHHTAVAMGFRMDYDLVRTGPDFPTLLATTQGYAMGAWVSIQLAEYIRMLGYSARAHHLANYQVIAVPVAVDCGLGELSRAGYLITKELGLGLRLAIVTTDMPLKHDKPVDLGAQSFCDYCKICAEECPGGSIPKGDKVEHNGIKKWKLNEETCYRYWHSVGTDCSICMAACPWTKPATWFHRAMAEMATIAAPHQLLMTWADKLFYGKHHNISGPDFIDAYKQYRFKS